MSTSDSDRFPSTRINRSAGLSHRAHRSPGRGTRLGWPAFGLAATLATIALSSCNSSDPIPNEDVIGAGAGGAQTMAPSGGGSTGGRATPPSNLGGGFNPLNPSEGIGGRAFEPAEACVAEQANTQPSPAFVEFLVDTSLSMDQDAPGAGEDRSKWELTRDVLLDALGTMSPETAVGLAFYPDVGVNAMPCFDGEQDVVRAPLGEEESDHRKRLADAFEQQDPDGSTPTHDAYVYSLDQLAEEQSGNGRFVVLITDGEPTYALGCQGTGIPGNGVETEPLIAESAAARDSGVRTFVIGSPGSENARESLSAMAEAGGTAPAGCSNDGPNYCHFDMTQEADFAEALRDALEQISGQTIGCSYDIPAPPSGAELDPTQVNVGFTSAATGETETLANSGGETCDAGWQYSSDNSQIVLCPATCERIAASPGEVKLAFGCATNTPVF